MNLADYLKQEGLTDAAFAATVPASRTQISRLRRGRTWLSAELARRITNATGGRVTVNDLLAAMPASREPTP